MISSYGAESGACYYFFNVELYQKKVCSIEWVALSFRATKSSESSVKLVPSKYLRAGSMQWIEWKICPSYKLYQHYGCKRKCKGGWFTFWFLLQTPLLGFVCSRSCTLKLPLPSQKCQPSHSWKIYQWRKRNSVDAKCETSICVRKPNYSLFHLAGWILTRPMPLLASYSPSNQKKSPGFKIYKALFHTIVTFMVFHSFDSKQGSSSSVSSWTTKIMNVNISFSFLWLLTVYRENFKLSLKDGEPVNTFIDSDSHFLSMLDNCQLSVTSHQMKDWILKASHKP